MGAESPVTVWRKFVLGCKVPPMLANMSGSTIEIILPVSTVSLQDLPATVPSGVSPSVAPRTGPALNDDD